MTEKQSILNKIKMLSIFLGQKLKDLWLRFYHSSFMQKLKEILAWENFGPKLKQAKEVIVQFTKEQPKTAAFIYVCIFSAFSIRFLDKAFALATLKNNSEGIWHAIETFNPSGWWFLILIFLWLVYMAIAGLSLTTDAFEKNLVKARMILFILLSLSLSSLVTILLNIFVGRYTPEFMESMHLYGFSAFRFRLSESSFPSFGVQSIWAVMLAVGFYMPRFKKLFIAIASIASLSLIFTAKCFISDAVMGAYIGIMMYHAAHWMFAENRENRPLITR